MSASPAPTEDDAWIITVGGWAYGPYPSKQEAVRRAASFHPVRRPTVFQLLPPPPECIDMSKVGL